MREYETPFIVQPEISDEGRAALKEKLDGVLARAGATRLLYEDWGKRKLAYEIRRFQKGHYLMLSFLDEGKAIPELERTLRLEESVLRYLTILVEEEVKDIEGRRTRAAEEERIQAERERERAAREAEEAKARQEAEEARAREVAAAAEKAAAEAETSGEEPAAGSEGSPTDEEGSS